MNPNPTDYFYDHLNHTLIGPGADVYGLEPAREILRTYPLNSYYSGILYPRRKRLATPDQTHDATTNGLSETETNADPETNDPETDAEQPTNSVEDAGSEETVERSRHETTAENAQPDVAQANQYFPHCMGLTVCLPKTTAHITVEFSAGRYVDLTKNWLSRAVSISQHDYDALINNPSLSDFFKNALTYEPLSSDAGLMRIGLPTTISSGEARKRLEPFQKDAPDKSSVALARLNLLLITELFRREPLAKTMTISVENDGGLHEVFANEKGESLARCHVKVVPHDGRKFVKLLLENSSTELIPKQFSLSNEKLNQQALFQTRIRVVGADLQPYKNRVTENPFDAEARQIAYQHRTIKAYGIGHGAAVQWEKPTDSIPPTWVETTFLPSVYIPAVSNGFRDDRPGQHAFADVAKLRNLSVWSDWTADVVCDKLDLMIADYQDWHQSQRAHSRQPDQKAWTDEAAPLLAGQAAAIARLRRNLALLRTNPAVFDCFRLANTAMYLQMIISREADFGATEKEGPAITTRLAENPGLTYTDLAFFEKFAEDPARPIAYRPFQLAFLVLNLESMVDDTCEDRTKSVDLIWFPTGGGKTEAYLALTAFTIFWRRTQYPASSGGVSVLMRYTLRLLTAQQFERASRLIVALEFLRRKQTQIPQPTDLGKTPITIGMWVGMATTPNELKMAQEKIGANSTLGKQIKLLNGQTPIPDTASRAESVNVFQVSACPWCGCKLITKDPQGRFQHGFGVNTKASRFTVQCLNQKCEFRNELPIDVVDESLYNHPPTLLFATVDKFALIAHREEAHCFFDSLNKKGNLPPDLIIQDELHLLNGPLGSVVGLFEGLVEKLCTKNGRRPKIVASTATTRNTAEQIKNLYGGRTVQVFPAQGLDYTDNYFSKNSPNARRRHIGFMPTGKTSMTTQVSALLPNLLFVRSLLLKKGWSPAEVSDYWTVVSYYNSLKQVGKVYSNVSETVASALKNLHDRHDADAFQYGYRYLMDRTTELTSRIESTRIKAILTDLGKELTLKTSAQGNLYVDGTTDLVLASNMFSVGIDVKRLNVMLMNGQPKNNAEYIQASSRVARESEGVVVNLLDANLAREKSYFEQYVHYHLAYYQYVEPLTVTPFTEITFGKVLNGLLIGYVRHIRGQHKEIDAKLFDGKIADVLALIHERVADPTARQQAEYQLETLAKDWHQLAQDRKGILKYKGDFIKRPTDKSGDDGDKSLWNVMMSMREVDTTSVIKIRNPIGERNTNAATTNKTDVIALTSASIDSFDETSDQDPEN